MKGSRMAKKQSVKTDIVATVMSRLKEKDKPIRTKRTLVLTESTYKVFEQFCRSESRYPSDVIDEFIKLFVEQSNK